jgi:hypothetical protein
MFEGGFEGGMIEVVHRRGMERGYPPQSTNSIPTSLTVAGFGFRTIGRLVTTISPTSIVTSLPIVLKPKPATVRLVSVVD